MNQSDLPTVRLLARNGAFSFTNHAYKQMLNRDVSFDDVEAILISPTNQIIECQSPSSTPEKNILTSVFFFMILAVPKIQ